MVTAGGMVTAGVADTVIARSAGAEAGKLAGVGIIVRPASGSRAAADTACIYQGARLLDRAASRKARPWEPGYSTSR